MAAPESTGDRERLQGTLSVVRPASPVETVKFETFIKITADGSVTAYNGHVDLGTGIRTSHAFEDHLREHVARPGLPDADRARAADELAAIIRRYGK